MIHFIMATIYGCPIIFFRMTYLGPAVYFSNMYPPINYMILISPFLVEISLIPFFYKLNGVVWNTIVFADFITIVIPASDLSKCFAMNPITTISVIVLYLTMIYINKNKGKLYEPIYVFYR